MAKGRSTKKSGKQPTVKVNPSVPGAHPRPAATSSSHIIQPDDIARLLSSDDPDAPVLSPTAREYYRNLMARSQNPNPNARQRYAPYSIPAALRTDGQAPSSAPSSQSSGTNLNVPQYPPPSSAPATAAPALPASMPSMNPIIHAFPRPFTFTTSDDSFPPPANSTVARHRPGPNLPTQTTRGHAPLYIHGQYYRQSEMPTAKPAAARPSRTQRTNPYPDSSATTPEPVSENEHDVPSPAAVRNAPATTSTSPTPEPNEVVDAPLTKKNFLTIPNCEWLRGPSAEEWARTELASFRFVPATLNEEEKNMFDDFFNFDMIED